MCACLCVSGSYLRTEEEDIASGGVKGKNNMKSNNGMRLREMIYGDVQLQQVSPTEELAVSRRDKKSQIECFPDRQGDNPAFCECKQERRYLSLPDDGVNTSVHQLGSCHCSPGALPPQSALQSLGGREDAPSAAGVCQHSWQKGDAGWHMAADTARVLLLLLTAPVKKQKNKQIRQG